MDFVRRGNRLAARAAIQVEENDVDRAGRLFRREFLTCDFST
jgi:hypothetical protein